MLTPVLVQEDTSYARERRDNSRPLMFGRPATASQTSTPLALLQGKRPAPSLFPESFGVYSVLEAFSQTSFSTPVIFAYELVGGAGEAKWQPDEFETRRTNHALLNQFRGQYVAQLVGYTVEVPDLNGPEWQDWPHPKADDDAALFPFRQVPQPIPPHTAPNIYFGQPRPWRIEAEHDPVSREAQPGQLLTYARPQVIPTTTDVPNFVGLKVRAALELATSLRLRLQDGADPYFFKSLELDPGGVIVAQSVPVQSGVPNDTLVYVVVARNFSSGTFVSIPNMYVGDDTPP